MRIIGCWRIAVERSESVIGEQNLAVLLQSLQPQLQPEPYVFCCVAQADADLVAKAFATVHEAEGLTLVLPATVAEYYRLPALPQWARITLMVHSSLEAVGMIAAISTRLSEHGISTNPIAGYYHDHVFVQWSRRFEALELIEQLGKVKKL
jgi:uncharacterized protein